MEMNRSSLKTALAANQRVKEKEYWLKKLSGFPVKVHFPYDGKSENGDIKYSRQTLRFVLPGELTLLLMKISSGDFHGVHMVLTTGLVVLLHKYTAADDIVVGMPIYKQASDSEFINTVVALRNQIIPGMTFRELLFQVRQTIMEAVENLNYPIDMLDKSLYRSIEKNNFSLFDMAVLLENIHEPSYLEPVRTSINMVFAFHLTGAAGHHSNLELQVDYNASLYEQSTIERIIAHFTRVTRVVLADTHIKVSEVSMLIKQEKQRLMDIINGPEESSDLEKTIHELFAEQVEKSGDGVAVVCMEQWAGSMGFVGAQGAVPLNGNVHLTYKELNQKSNRLAHMLREKGVQADVIVGLMAERNVEMVIGILAIIKAGGAYLAVDAQYPETRKKYMLENSGVSLILTNIGEGDFIAGDVQFIDIRNHDIYKTDDYQNPEHLAKNGNPSSSLLYVIYTSGSTGKPKGVMLEHRNLVNLVRFQYRYTTIDFSRVLQFTNISFDVAYQEIFSTLLKGGTLCLTDKVVRQDIPGLFRMVDRQQIKTLFLPASFAKFVFNNQEYLAELPRSAAHIVTAGEQIVVGPLFRQYLEQNNISLHNHYGPSEAHVVTTLTVGSGQKIPELPGIGKPVANTQIYILDPNKQMLPVGLPGEIYIGGIQVGRGYLNRPELTAEKFIDHRSYKTGDLGRWLQDGTIEFLGRMDYQVKIRGFRVELGEIESELMKHEAVKEAVVIDRESESGERYLCAYIVPGHERVDITELEEHLSQTLPGFMVPSYFVWMKEIPLTPNKKVDRKALPEPGKIAGDTYAPPQTRLEKELAAIWSRVLGIEPQHIGIDDNFFSLGGHSLKATILISRINKALGVNVLLAEVFTFSTIRQLAKHIRDSAKTAQRDIEPVEEKEYYPLSPSQKRLYILQRMDKNNMSYNMPGVLILEGDLEKERFEEVFNRLIKRHESFRTSFRVADEEPVQRVQDTVDFEIEYHSLERRAESVEQRVQDEELYALRSTLYASFINNFVRPFDLSQSPLLRLGLIKLASREHILMFDMHHIITDGTSQGIFTREFLQLYEGQELPLLNLQYKDYSQWQRSRDQQEGYWSERFRGELPVLVLPYDFSRPSVTRFEGNRTGFLLEKAETGALHRAARQEGASLYMVLLAVFNVLLWKLSGQEDIIIGTPIAARRHADLDPIIGMFVNTLVMRHFPTGSKTVKAFLQEVKANTLEAFENQEYPFEELVEKVKVARDAGRNPLFDVMFALQNWERAGGEIPGLAVKPYPFENRTAKFDLNLDAMEMAGQITFSLEYSTALFEESTIQKFTGYFKKIVAHITTPGSMETKLSHIDILEPEEKQQLLEMANGPDEPPDMQKTIHELFAEQASRTPDGVSIVGKEEIVGAQHAVPLTGNVHLTYKDLNEKSNQLGHLLRKKGVGPDTIVGICMEPSIELIIGILGILKAGGAYLPIDPEYPRERIKFMLDDSNATLLLTSDELLNVGEGTACRAPTILPAGSLVYIIYTSGSTGTPKGVMLEHRNLVNLLLYQYCHTTIDFSRVLQFTTISFDVSFQEIFSTLLAGGTLFLVNKEIKQDIPGLFELVDKNKIRTLFLPASFLKFVLNNEEYVQRIPRGVTHIVTAGEQLVVPPAFKEYIVSQNIQLHNHYGPSETHVVTTLTLDPGSDGDIPELPPIGRPISNTGIYIVDREGQLQPRGVAGELLIAGASVGRGYLNQPELSAEKFVDHRSYRSYRTYRSYKTGDLARWLQNGTIEFLGRMDHQVKIRGFRVELGEVENSLMALSGIKEAVVTARRDEKGENYLCAYVTAENEVDVNVSLLRQQLSTRLPDFMLPSRFMKLNQIPLTPSKKVDRSALPEPEASRPKLETVFLAPTTRTEKLIADTWKEILKLDKIGINDNFFHLGGNSLSLIKANSKLKEILNKEIPVMMMFQFPTIHSLALHIMEEEKQNKQADLERKVRLKKLDKGKARLKETRRKLEGFA